MIYAWAPRYGCTHFGGTERVTIHDMDKRSPILLRKTHLSTGAGGIRNAWVGGSNPSCGTKHNQGVNAPYRPLNAGAPRYKRTRFWGATCADRVNKTRP
jgi:hypothetical protein